MTDLVQWGLAVVQWVQTFRTPILDQFFLTINFLGDEEFYLLFLPILFWCLDKRLGIRLGVIFLFSFYTNEFLKNLFAEPRPYQVDAKLYSPIRTEGYGIPSGHAQGTATTWGYLATQLKTPFWWALAFGVPVLVSIGRIYLGDHYPQDVIAGLALGALFVAAYAIYEPRVSAWLGRQSPAAQVWLVVALSIALALLHLTTNTAHVIGVFLGFYAMLVFEEHTLRFDVRAIWWIQIVKLALGLAVMLGLRFGLKAIFPANNVFDLIRYAIMGIWVGAGAPWLFVVVRLSQRGMTTKSLALENTLTAE